MIFLKNEGLNKLRDQDERLVSYNVEMTEVTGGTFWKEYTKEQIDGTEEFPTITDVEQMGSLMQVYPPIDLKEKQIVKLAKELGKACVRVSGSWATNTYYDIDGHTGGVVPEGYAAVLTKEQWDNVLDFVKEVDGLLLISFANCKGARKDDGSWDDTQAKLLLDYSKNYGVPVSYVEFMNEPNLLSTGPKSDYSAAEYAKDQDDCFRMIQECYPEIKTVGPCTLGNDGREDKKMPKWMNLCTGREILENTKETPDIFSYHYYAGVSERGKLFGKHWEESEVLSELYFNEAVTAAKCNMVLRDEFVPGADMWVTESGDAGCGGNTWGSTFLDVFRTADEFGAFSKITRGVIFHNTLASSDYGYLDHKDYSPRPNYFIALIWNRIMGTEVYEAGEEGHVYAHSRKDKKPGIAYMILNPSKEEKITVTLAKDAVIYSLTGEKLRTKTMMLNGKPLVLDEQGNLPVLDGKEVKVGQYELEPLTITFIVL